MGGTDYIENPGPYLHRSSKRAPHMGVLSTPFLAKLPAAGAPLPPLPPLDESRFATREEAIKAYAARLDALKALDEAAKSEVRTAPPAASETTATAPAEAGKDFETVMESLEEESLEPALAADGTTGSSPQANPLVPDRSGPFEPVSTPLYPAEHSIGRPNDNGIRTPRWRGG